MQQLTLCYLLTATDMCLGYKKRGFGSGLYNGYGGKVEPDEALLAAAVREVQEEANVVVQETDLQAVAELTFVFSDRTLAVAAYFCTKWQGTPQETEEMRPEWFSLKALPFDQMWADDIVWLPRALAGEYVRGTVWFADDGRSIAGMEWQ